MGDTVCRQGSPTSKIGLGAALVVNTAIVLAGTLVFFVARAPHANFFPAGTPWTLYIGGVCGFVIILCLAFVFPKIGAAWAIALVVLGQSAAALVIDHYGLLGMPRDSVTVARVAGLALVAVGVALLRGGATVSRRQCGQVERTRIRVGTGETFQTRDRQPHRVVNASDHEVSVLLIFFSGRAISWYSNAARRG
jgi:transporter family-2 protein